MVYRPVHRGDMKTLPLEGPLRLKNNGTLEFFFLGTGSAFVKQNFQNNLLIIKGEDHLLIDCGAQCPIAFSKYQSAVANVRNVYITHSHSDHAGGLEELALMHRYGDKIRPKMIITDYYRDLLWNQTLKGGLAYGEQRPTPYNANEPNGYLTFDDYFEQVTPRLISSSPRPLWEADCGSIHIEFFRTMHIPDSVPSWKESAWSTGILVDGRIFFPADTRFDPDLLFWMEERSHPEFIFHDCQSFNGGVHTGIEELKSLPPDLKKKIFLCHYSDNFSNYDAEANGFYGMARPGVYYNFDL